MKLISKCKKCGIKTITIRGRTFDEAVNLFRWRIAFEGIEKLRK